MLPPPGIPPIGNDIAVAVGVDNPTASLISTVIAAATAVMSSAVPAAASSTPSVPNAVAVSPSTLDDSEGECRLLGSFALLVQAALGLLALSSLVFKRWRERPQRPVKIWFFDVSKQVFGSVLVHIANIFMSMLTSGSLSIKLASVSAPQMLARSVSGDPDGPNPCSFYLLNLGIDTTLGIPILIVLLRLTTIVVSYTPLGKPAESIQSGHYGSPPNAWWWLKQSVIYFFCLFGMKICVLIIFIFMPWISIVGDWALSWTAGNEKLQIAFVMMIFPLIMNGLQYYIIDSFIKKKEAEHELLPSDDLDSRRGLYDDEAWPLDSSDDDSDSDVERVAAKPAKVGRKVSEDEYDPDTDGVAPTVIGSSGSSREIKAAKPISPVLLPKE